MSGQPWRQFSDHSEFGLFRQQAELGPIKSRDQLRDRLREWHTAITGALTALERSGERDPAIRLVEGLHRSYGLPQLDFAPAADWDAPPMVTLAFHPRQIDEFYGPTGQLRELRDQLQGAFVRFEERDITDPENRRLAGELRRLGAPHAFDGFVIVPLEFQDFEQAPVPGWWQGPNATNATLLGAAQSLWDREHRPDLYQATQAAAAELRAAAAPVAAHGAATSTMTQEGMSR